MYVHVCMAQNGNSSSNNCYALDMLKVFVSTTTLAFTHKWAMEKYTLILRPIIKPYLKPWVKVLHSQS